MVAAVPRFAELYMVVAVHPVVGQYMGVEADR
jgi:hypothetical protein